MPGAFAYHLQSFSARTLRSTSKFWCGPLLAAGATATMGSIDEPFLDGSPNIGVFFACWLPGGFTFGEAAYACQKALSWQTTVIGDPLYRPFGKTPRQQHDALEQRHSKLIEWADLRYADESLVLGLKPAEVVQYLLRPDVPQDSAVLAEKLAELYQIEGQDELSIKAFRRALKLGPTPQQKVRLTLNLSDRLIAAGHEADALALCDEFLKKTPDYPDALGLYTKMEALANKLGQSRQAERYARQITKLTAGK
jgi:tetratricopeptide (TPR) repeat protein